ncbi:hypothetical protein RN22_05870, partial [Grimontia sp. AD028]|uniref:hypothetical protein n=1 Tax=Grimontia sp. AD028 TaxID=1581149 RepID=UPI00061B2E4D
MQVQKRGNGQKSCNQFYGGLNREGRAWMTFSQLSQPTELFIISYSFIPKRPEDARIQRLSMRSIR